MQASRGIAECSLALRGEWGRCGGHIYAPPCGQQSGHRTAQLDIGKSAGMVVAPIDQRRHGSRDRKGTIAVAFGRRSTRVRAAFERLWGQPVREEDFGELTFATMAQVRMQMRCSAADGRRDGG